MESFNLISPPSVDVPKATSPSWIKSADAWWDTDTGPSVHQLDKKKKSSRVDG